MCSHSSKMSFASKLEKNRSTENCEITFLLLHIRKSLAKALKGLNPYNLLLCVWPTTFCLIHLSFDDNSLYLVCSY